MSAAKPAKPKARSASELRQEFYSLPDDALVSRAMAGAASFHASHGMDRLAVVGGGPPYRIVGRVALYKKGDVLRWMESRSLVRNSAEALQARGQA